MTADEPEPIIGELIVDTFDYDGGRSVTVYVPPDPPEIIVFAGDGQLISRWGRHLEREDTPPTMIVGVHPAVGDDGTKRLHEYSPSFDERRFEAHERFFVDDVHRWAQVRFGVEMSAERTVACGVSASGELSLAMGLRHPDVFGVVFSASPGAGYRPPVELPERLPRTYLTAGTLEPFFLDNATRWADALRGAGADVVFTERGGDHGDPFWVEEFSYMIAWVP